MTIHNLEIPTSESLSEILICNLRKLANKYGFQSRAEVTFKLGNASQGNDKVCAIELKALGPRIVARSNSDNFATAVNEIQNNLERQLRRNKKRFTRRIARNLRRKKFSCP